MLVHQSIYIYMTNVMHMNHSYDYYYLSLPSVSGKAVFFNILKDLGLEKIAKDLVLSRCF